MEPQANLKKQRTAKMKNKLLEIKKKELSDMLNIILDSTEETINKLEVRSKGITPGAARRNKELENTNI